MNEPRTGTSEGTAYTLREKQEAARRQARRDRDSNKHDYQPLDHVGNPCNVCGFDRHHPWHQ